MTRYKQIRDQSLVQNVLHFLLVQGLPRFPGLGPIPLNDLLISLPVLDMNPFRLPMSPVAIGADDFDRVVGCVGCHSPYLCR